MRRIINNQRLNPFSYWKHRALVFGLVLYPVVEMIMLGIAILFRKALKGTVSAPKCTLVRCEV